MSIVEIVFNRYVSNGVKLCNNGKRSNEPHFFLHCYSGEMITPGCTVWKQQVGRDNVMAWATFCWNTQGLIIHMESTFLYITKLNINENQVHSYMALPSRIPVASFTRVMHFATLHEIYENGFRNIVSILMFIFKNISSKWHIFYLLILNKMGENKQHLYLVYYTFYFKKSKNAYQMQKKKCILWRRYCEWMNI